jgi:hypothetical protein
MHTDTCMHTTQTGGLVEGNNIFSRKQGDIHVYICQLKEAPAGINKCSRLCVYVYVCMHNYVCVFGLHTCVYLPVERGSGRYLQMQQSCVYVYMYIHICIHNFVCTCVCLVYIHV